MTIAFKISAEGASHVGMVRKTNQDAYLIDSKENIFIVADGMGGHAGGEIASQMCIDITRDEMKKSLTNSSLKKAEILEHFSQAINKSSKSIYNKALEDPKYKGMGTTIVALYFHDTSAFLAHAGDSRVYLLRSGFLYQLTKDHSLVNEQIEAGALSEEDAKIHKLRNVITRCIGYQEEELIDTQSLEVENEDYLILCSDGLHGKLSAHEISQEVYKLGTKAVEPLIDLALKRGGEDNITVLILKILNKQ